MKAKSSQRGKKMKGAQRDDGGDGLGLLVGSWTSIEGNSAECGRFVTRGNFRCLGAIRVGGRGGEPLGGAKEKRHEPHPPLGEATSSMRTARGAGSSGRRDWIEVEGILGIGGLGDGRGRRGLLRKRRVKDGDDSPTGRWRREPKLD